MKNIIVLIFLAAFFSASVMASEPKPAGLWIGLIETGDALVPLEIEIHDRGEHWESDLIFPQEGRFRVRTDTTRIDNRQVSLSARDGLLTLEAELDGDHLIGVVTNRGREDKLRLGRENTQAAAELIEEIQTFRAALRSDPLVRTVGDSHPDGLEQEHLDALVDQADASQTTSMVLRKDGQVIGEWHRNGQPRLVESMSVTKAVVNLVLGRLVTLGKIESIDLPAHHWFPEWSSGEYAEITLQHLLTHTSGLEPATPTSELYQSGDFIRFALDAPLVAPPGTEVRYNNNALNLLAMVAEKAAGQHLEEFLANDLFALLGIADFNWSRDPADSPQGMAGLQITAGDLGRLGQLALDRGLWEGQQLINASWFEQSFSPATGNAEPTGGLARSGIEVGLIWFLISDDKTGSVTGAMHSGYLGQYLVLDFENQLVAVRLIQNTAAYDPDSDAFAEFPKQVNRLVTTRNDQ